MWTALFVGKASFSPLGDLGSLVKDLLALCEEFISRLFILFCWFVFLFLFQGHTVLIIVHFIVLQLGNVHPVNLFFKFLEGSVMGHRFCGVP